MIAGRLRWPFMAESGSMYASRVRTASYLPCAWCVSVAAAAIVSVGTWPGVAGARGIKVAPASSTVVDAVSDAFQSQKPLHGQTIVRVSVTKTKPVFALVVSELKTKAKQAHATVSTGQSPYRGTVFARQLGRWHWDAKASAPLLAALKHNGDLNFHVTFRATGSETFTSQAPGDLSDNPYCTYAPQSDTSEATFTYRAGSGLGYISPDPTSDSAGFPGFGQVDATGTDQTTNAGGCISGTGGAPSPPSTTSCSAKWVEASAFSDIQVRTLLTPGVDSRGRHALVIVGPAVNKVPPDCGAPDLWTISPDGPLVYGKPFLIPDAEIQSASRIANQTRPVATLKVAVNTNEPCEGGTFPGTTCTDQLQWSGVLNMTVRRVDLDCVQFAGPAPAASDTQCSNASRG